MENAGSGASREVKGPHWGKEHDECESKQDLRASKTEYRKWPGRKKNEREKPSKSRERGGV